MLSTSAVSLALRYHKGRPSPEELAELHKVAGEIQVTLKLALGMPNVGRAEHTCAHHISTQYARLADITLFIKDTAAYHSHLGIGLRLLAFSRRLPELTDFWCARPPTLVDLNFTISEYKSEMCWRYGKCYANESFIQAAVRPFGRWLASKRVRARGRNGTASACYGGFFAASRDAILTSSRALYTRLAREVSIADSLEVGHYLERSWPSLFHIRHQPRSRFVRVAVYTGWCSKVVDSWGEIRKADKLRRLIAFSEEGKSVVALRQTKIPLGLYPGDVCDKVAGVCLHSLLPASEEHKAYGRGASNRFQFWMLADGESSSLANLTGHGWNTCPLAVKKCRPRQLMMLPHKLPCLSDFDYVAFVSLDAVDIITVHPLLRAIAQPLASFSRAAVAIMASQSVESNISSFSLASVQAVVSRTSSNARAFGEMWFNLSSIQDRMKHPWDKSHERNALVAAMHTSGQLGQVVRERGWE